MDTGLLTQIAMGIALSACACFRVFVPMLAAAIGTQHGWILVKSVSKMSGIMQSKAPYREKENNKNFSP